MDKSGRSPQTRLDWSILNLSRYVISHARFLLEDARQVRPVVAQACAHLFNRDRMGVLGSHITDHLLHRALNLRLCQR